MEQTAVASRTITTARTVKAPRELVFRAWTDPDILARWWGPNGFSNTFHTFDVTPGGTWDFIMHGPDGQDYPNTCVFREIVPNERLVFDHLKEMHFYHAVVDFLDDAGGTRIEWNMRFNTAEELEPIRKFIEAANEQNMDRLELALKPHHA